MTLDRRPDFTPEELAPWTPSRVREKWPRHADLLERLDIDVTRPPRYEDTTAARELLGYRPQIGLEQVWDELAGDGLSSEADWRARLSH